MPRKIKPVDYWKRLLKDPTLTAADRIKAVEAIERIEAADARKKSKVAKEDRPQSHKTVTNPAVFGVFDKCKAQGFTGGFDDWTRYMHSIPPAIGHHWQFFIEVDIDWKRVAGRDRFEDGDLRPPRPHSQPPEEIVCTECGSATRCADRSGTRCIWCAGSSGS